jgi:hypothetical protein
LKSDCHFQIDIDVWFSRDPIKISDRREQRNIIKGNVDLHDEFVLLNNDEINEAFDRGVMGIFEFDGRDVAAVDE